MLSGVSSITVFLAGRLGCLSEVRSLLNIYFTSTTWCHMASLIKTRRALFRDAFQSFHKVSVSLKIHGMLLRLSGTAALTSERTNDRQQVIDKMDRQKACLSDPGMR